MSYPSNGYEEATVAELRQFIAQVQEIESEEKELKELKKDKYAEIKSRGYDTKVFRKLISYLKKDPDDVAEQEAIFETYLSAIRDSSSAGDDSDVLD